MTSTSNPTDPLSTDRTLFKKVTDFIESRGKVSKVAINALLITSAYALVSAVIPPQYVLWAWQVVMSSIFLLALGIFAWHETIGVAQVMKPIYKLLYRLTGDKYFLELTETKKVLE